MSSEDFDKKIRDAADQHYPAYNEKAWSKMNKLLDEHLPEEKKKDRKGLIFFLLLFLLLGGASWYFLTRPSRDGNLTQTHSGTQSHSKNEVSNSSDVRAKGSEKEHQSTDALETNAGPNTKKVETKLPADSNIPVNLPSNSAGEKIGDKQEPVASTSVQFPPTNIDANRKQVQAPKSRAKEPIKVNAPVYRPETKNSSLKDIVKVPKEVQDGGNIKVVQSTPDTGIPSREELSKVQPNPDNKIQLLDTASKKPEPEVHPLTITKNTGKEKSKSKKDRGLYFSLSAGPDISLVGLSNTGKLRPVIGVGLAYKFSDRFTLRSGFYAADKIYTASPDQYKPSYTPSPNFVYLSKVDADCKVYEIPLALAYTFGKPGRQNWFASMGMSTYIMKTEKYDYLYKMPNGTSYSYQRTINDENKHFFSVVSLSGGYSRKLNEIFSISAEPYLKLPVNGVGIGNIKLNSAGILFSINARLTGIKK